MPISQISLLIIHTPLISIYSRDIKKAKEACPIDVYHESIAMYHFTPLLLELPFGAVINR